MKILVFGSLNIDLVFSVDHIVGPGETINSAVLKKSAGGKGANQAAALAKAGLEQVYMAGKIGRDGLFLVDLLRSYGVHTDWVVCYEGATGQAIIQLDKNKENAIVLYDGGNGRITSGEISRVLAAFNKGDIILLQNEITGLPEIIEGAKNRGLTICFNPSPYNKDIEGLPLDAVNVFFVNEIEGAALAKLPPNTPPPDILEGLIRRFPGSESIVTAGKDGAYYGNGTIRKKGNIINVPVVDTTGAGDTFTGYFLAARIRGDSAAGALERACKAASITVSRFGAMDAIPWGTEVFPEKPTTP